MSSPTAIETRYAGCRFRSRLEARWAVFFDTLGISWEYEPEGYVVGGAPYLPDFRIQVPSDRPYPYWFEVKPPYALSDARHRALCDETGMPLLVARGMPKDFNDQHRGESPTLTIMLPGVELRGEFVEGDVPACCGGLWDMIHKGRHWTMDTNPDVHVALVPRVPRVPDGDCTGRPLCSPLIDMAYTAARSARFEYGESG